MNRSVLARGAAVALTAACCSLGAAPAFAATAGPADGTSPTYTLDFTNTTFSPSATAGSTIVGTGTVQDQSGATVGTVDDACTLISVDPSGDGMAQCTDTLNINGDQLVLSTLGRMDPSPMNAGSFGGEVQGGTGAYDGAAGDASFQVVSPGVYTVTLNLQ